MLWYLLCCCGIAPAYFVLSRVAVVKLLLAFGFAVLLWGSSCSLLHFPCCYGAGPAYFLISRVAVVLLLIAFRFPLLLW